MALSPEERSDKLLMMLRGSSVGLLAKPRSARGYRREEPQRGKAKKRCRDWIFVGDADEVEDRPRKMIQASPGGYMGMRMMRLDAMGSAGSTRPGVVVGGPMARRTVMSNWKQPGEMDSRCHCHLSEIGTDASSSSSSSSCLVHLRRRCLRRCVLISEPPLWLCYLRSSKGR